MMKRTIILCICLLAMLPGAVAQRGLHVEPIFAGRVIPKQRVEETLVKGESIEKYKLSLFRSLKMEVDSLERERIEQLVLRDGEGMEESPEAEYEMSGGHLSYCILALPARRKRYLCYQCYEPRPGAYHLTLVYMEGWATLRDLHKTFKRK